MRPENTAQAAWEGRLRQVPAGQGAPAAGKMGVEELRGRQGMGLAP